MSNSTLSDGPGSLTNDHSTADFFIGLGITLGASVLNAFGLNLTKLDHQRQALLSKTDRSKDFLRPLWLAGLLSYIISQLVGSTLALEYLRSEYVAPLGSSSLIFNFIFARLLVGSKVSRSDILGTLVIIIGVVGVVAFGNQRSKDAPDVEAHLDLAMLKQLWGKGPWLAWFLILCVLTTIIWWLASIADEVLQEREELDSEQERPDEDRYGSGGRRPVDPNANSFLRQVQKVRNQTRKLLKGHFASWAASKPDASVKRIGGFLFSVLAGTLAGMTLVFAKSAVKLFTAQSDHPDDSQFASPLSIFILLVLVFTAVAQIWALNKGLKIADSTIVVPCMFACYSGFGFTNSLFYLDQLNVYSKTVTAMIVISLLILVAGVGILSSKKIEALIKKPEVDLEAVPGDDGGQPSSVFERAKEAMGAVNFQRGKKPGHGSQLLGRGADQPEQTPTAHTTHELQDLPDDDYDDRRASMASDATITKNSPFDDAHQVGAGSRRRGSLDSTESTDDFGQFVVAKDGSLDR